MKTITANIRLLSHQLAKPTFKTPKDLVSWMGAVQAQEYNMAKWAVGVRLKSPKLQEIETALQKGEIIRTHVMRPTWHFVAAEDIRWMLKLSGHRIKAANESFGRSMGVDESLYPRCNDLIIRMLEGNKSLTREEISIEFEKAGIAADSGHVRRFLTRAEADAIICSGPDKGKQPTYALLEERVPIVPELTKEEALATLARRYFMSHSPATMNDFLWWSGLNVSDARQALSFIETELIKEQDFFIHESYNSSKSSKDVLHLLPSFDEYLISYKDRTAVLHPDFHHKAFNRWGIFYPVVLHNGKIIGNWKKGTKKVECTFFEQTNDVAPELIEAAQNRFKSFIGK